MNLNRNQIIAIVIAVLGVMIGSTAQLTDLFGATATKSIISVASLLNSVLSSILAVITSQGNTVKDVLSMTGVEHLSVNKQANTTLANMAVDPTLNKIAPTQDAMATVIQTAEGNK